MASVLEHLSDGNAQVLVTTHSPYFVSGKGFHNVRMIRDSRADKCTKVSFASHNDLSAMLSGALGEESRSATTTMAAVEQIMQPSQNELFFTKAAIFVEGLEDVAYISTYMQLTGRWHNFRKFGCHFIVCDGKNRLSRPLAIAKLLGIPSFAIADGDTNCQQNERDNHRRDNQCILRICQVDGDPFPKATQWLNGVVLWTTCIKDEVKAEFGDDLWNAVADKVRNDHGLANVSPKNTIFIAGVLEELYGQKKLSKILDQLCDHILDYAAKYHE